MFRFLQGCYRASQIKHTRTGHARSFRLGVELLEGRLVPSTISAVSWQSGGVIHHALYAIGSDDAVYVNVDATGYTNLGGYALAISAGLDAVGNPEVYAIGTDHAVYVNRGSGYTNLGGYALQISATVQDTVYAIGTDHAVYENAGGGGYTNLGGYALAISASLDVAGNLQVFAIGSDNGLYLNQGGGFIGLGGYARQVAAPTVGVGVPGDVAYVVGSDHAGYLNQGGVYTGLGGYIQG